MDLSGVGVVQHSLPVVKCAPCFFRLEAGLEADVRSRRWCSVSALARVNDFGVCIKPVVYGCLWTA